MSAPRVMMITLLLVTATSSAFYRLPLKRQQRSVQPWVKQDGTKVSLRNIEEVYYVVTIRIGDDPRDFLVVPDTGSSFLILPSSKCEQCGNHTAFQCPQDSSFTVDISYISGQGTGRFCMHDVTFGGLTVQNQHFLLMEKQDRNLQSKPYDGILGMGFRTNSWVSRGTTGYPYVPAYYFYVPKPVIQNMKEQGFLSSSVFSFYFSRDRHEGSEVTLGGSDPSHYTGNLSYASIIPEQSEWKVPLEGFKIGSTDLGSCNYKPCTALIDTGSVGILVPLSDGFPLFESLRNVAPSLVTAEMKIGRDIGFLFGVESKDLAKLEPIDIYIAGEKFTLEPREYVFQVGDKGMYLLELVVLPQDSWILGRSFLRKVYTEFDMEYRRIGFARAK